MNHSGAEALLVHQLQVHPEFGTLPRAATYHDRGKEQMALIHQSGPERVGREAGTGNGHVVQDAPGARRRVSYRRGVIRRRVIVSGDVQGVFFRDTCRRVATAELVHGWVRNLPDGSV